VVVARQADLSGWLGVVDTASLLPALQAGLAAVVGATSTGGTGCTALVQIMNNKGWTKRQLMNCFIASLFTFQCFSVALSTSWNLRMGQIRQNDVLNITFNKLG